MIQQKYDIGCFKRYGYSGGGEEETQRCLFCGSDVFPSLPHVESDDGIFCDMECCHNYYRISEYE